jgi:hypothetical protein
MIKPLKLLNNRGELRGEFQRSEDEAWQREFGFFRKLNGSIKVVEKTYEA